MERTVNRTEEKRMGWRSGLARFLAAAMGLVLVLASLLKAMDLELFVRQIKAYGLITQPMLVPPVAWGMIAFQFTLGVGLLVFYRPKITLSLATALWTVLLGVTSWAAITGVTDACGCYGAWLEHSPLEATVENFVFLAATLAAWWLAPGYQRLQWSTAKIWAVRTAAVIGLGLPLFFGYPLSAMIQPENKEQAALGSFVTEGLEGIDLDKGEYLIVVFGTDCHHCIEATPDLNYLAEEHGVPPVIGLCAAPPEESMRFQAECAPLFPIGRISEDTFWQLLGDGELPRLLLVRDGRIQRAWNKEVPEATAVLNR
jgi:hypothetical protein